MSRPGADEFVLTIACPDRPGIVYAVSHFLVRHSANIVESAQFGDRLDERFFMRVHFETLDAKVTLTQLREEFEHVAESFQMTWQMHDASAKFRTLILVSSFGHCLNDLLFRWRTGALNIDIPGIVSNHTDFADLAATYGVPFHHIPVAPDTKAAAEARLVGLIEDLDIHLERAPIGHGRRRGLVSHR